MKSGKLRNQRGIAMVETAITLIPFFVFIMAVFEAGWFFYTQATITHAAREGAKQAVLPAWGGSNTLMSQGQVQTFVAPFLTPIGVNCPSCITLTSSTVNLCSGCSAPRNALMAHVRVEIPYRFLTLSWFGLSGFTMHGDGFMRKETSTW